jgi:diadenosine tetraphosphate (Ap4A) HIT family hydrolase
LVWQGQRCRVIRASEAGYPAFYRVVWQCHVAEWTDLALADRAHCLDVVATVESALRGHLEPDKINLASLGNMVPHLHWHVVARFAWDRHFPAPVWAAALRGADVEHESAVAARLPALEAELAQALDRLA